MRLLLIGTGPFGVPAFERLAEGPHEIVGVVTTPIKILGKGVAPPCPVREFALSRGIPLLEPERINSSEAHQQIRSLRPDLLVLCDYGQILSAETLGLAPLGGVNLHASLLPKYRGAAPIPWAIYHGETETGVSVIHMTPEVDAGPVIAQAALAIDPEETAGELEVRLAQLGAELLPKAIELVATGEAKPIPQDPQLASKAPRLKKSHGQIDWARSAQQIKNQVRAMSPWPRAYTFWLRNDRPPVRLILHRVDVASEASGEKPPGTVLEAEKDRLIVNTGQGQLAVLSIQPEGRNVLTAAEFLRGYRMKAGDQLGTPQLSGM
ncbi:MAG: methionyl-tRNA formyltransferase [Thermoguttaceae bacterium]|nr:methionyl-tRNA formyltransferase [Thermoguttaceae bacterium]MDW8078933.1 methionyl-tRNA formyltransferase [Thermoguttaceae bacterium]